MKTLKENIPFQCVTSIYEKNNVTANSQYKKSVSEKTEVHKIEIDSNKDNSFTTAKISKERLNLIVEFVFLENTENKNFCIKLWIVHSKLYKIIDLSTFLKFYLNESKIIKLNEKLTYNCKTHTFSTKDKRILKILSEAYDSKFNKEKSIQLKSSSQIFLKDNELVEILKLLQGKKFLLNKDNNRKKIYIKNENMPLSFNVKSLSSFLIINHSKSTPIALTENGEFFYFNNFIYAPTISQRDAYMPIYKKFDSDKKNSIAIYKNLDEATFNSFFESMDKCGVNISIKDKFYNNANKDSLKAKFHLDFAQGKIILNVRFLYDRMEVNPFNNKKYIACQIVENRNLKKEYYIFNIIKGLNFEMTNLCFVLEDTNSIREFIQKGFLQLAEFGEIHKTDNFMNYLIHS